MSPQEAQMSSRSAASRMSQQTVLIFHFPAFHPIHSDTSTGAGGFPIENNWNRNGSPKNIIFSPPSASVNRTAGPSTHSWTFTQQLGPYRRRRRRPFPSCCCYYYSCYGLNAKIGFPFLLCLARRWRTFSTHLYTSRCDKEDNWRRPKTTVSSPCSNHFPMGKRSLTNRKGTWNRTSQLNKVTTSSQPLPAISVLHLGSDKK